MNKIKLDVTVLAVRVAFQDQQPTYYIFMSRMAYRMCLVKVSVGCVYRIQHTPVALT